MRYVCRVCSRSRRWWGLQNTSLYEDQKTTLWGATHILLEVLSIKQWERTSLGCLSIECEQSLFCQKICEQARHVSILAELSRAHRVVFALVLAPAPIVARDFAASIHTHISFSLTDCLAKEPQLPRTKEPKYMPTMNNNQLYIPHWWVLSWKASEMRPSDWNDDAITRKL